MALPSAGLGYRNQDYSPVQGVQDETCETRARCSVSGNALDMNQMLWASQLGSSAGWFLAIVRGWVP